MELEIWSDIACPWCYVGKRRLERALSEFEHADEVTVRWRSFELDPSAPADNPQPHAEMLAAKYGMSVDEARASAQRLADLAAAEGLDYHLGEQRLGSTFDGHRLVHLAAEHGLQDQMKERLLKARLVEGQLISDPEVLSRCAVEVGLDGDEVRSVLASDQFADEVRGDERTAQALGISGVPTFVVDRSLAASGAQPSEQLLALLRQGWERAGVAA